MPATVLANSNESGFFARFYGVGSDVPIQTPEFGSNYLARMLYVFEGNDYLALAAYNAGPGNVMNWAKVAGQDPDVFLNTIRYLETRVYIRNITEIFNRYSLIYGN